MAQSDFGTPWKVAQVKLNAAEMPLLPAGNQSFTSWIPHHEFHQCADLDLLNDLVKDGSANPTSPMHWCHKC